MDESLLIQLLEELGSSKINRTNSYNISSQCPFASRTHGNGFDKNPSFSISTDEVSRWKCFSCDQRGISVRSLCQRIIQIFGPNSREGLIAARWRDSEQSKKPTGYTLKIFNSYDQKPKFLWSTSQKKEEAEFNWSDFSDLTTDIAPYALERGITKEQYIKWKLGWEKKTNKLFIPIFDELQKFSGYSMRAIPPIAEGVPRYKHAKGFVKENYLFGECHRIREHRTIILVEGFMDVLTLERAGLANAFCVMGTSVSDKQLQKIHYWSDVVIIIPDNDKRNETTGIAAGEKAAREWESRIRALGKKVIVSPVLTGRKDVGDWTRREISFVLNKISEGHKIRLPIATFR